MRKLLLTAVFISMLSALSYAAHIKGGFFTYEYLGPGGSATSAKYRVTLTVYMVCNATSAQISNPINFSIFNALTNQFVQDIPVEITAQYNLNKGFDEPCISGNQQKCYYKIIVYDLPSLELPLIPGGYTIAYQRCCRIAGIQNINNSGAVGNTFSITIPGTIMGMGYEKNSSPQFLVNDTAVVCKSSYFQYSFAATDPDAATTGDSLSYEFCDAFTGASQTEPAPVSSTNPPFTVVPYAPGFSGSQPMGTGVTIDPKTGVISGVAPAAAGEYVLCVCVNEYRDGVLIGRTRKELHVEVGDCEPLKALLNPKPTTCDGFIVNFQNDAPGNPSETQYIWTFGDPASGVLDTSFDATPSHDYTTAGAGTYTVRLKVFLPGGLCEDETSFTVNVFPGFFPQLDAFGSCYTRPFRFEDQTRTTYGTVDTWRWDFGDPGTLADTSHAQFPLWTYGSPGTKKVTLRVTNSKGCISTITKDIVVLDKPPITMAFKDTLICIPDAVTLGASSTGPGTFTWTPTTSMTGSTTPNPTVNPTTTTKYYAEVNEGGCTNIDSVLVRVVSEVTLIPMGDTTICRTDQVILRAITDGLDLTWSPAATLDNPKILNPVATPTAQVTPYQLLARIGSCTKTATVNVTTVPYPVANAGPPHEICYNTSAQLNGSHDGSTFFWTPATYLDNPRKLNPVSTPPRTTQYILTSFDTKGCPKPGRDTVVVTVRPRIRPFAGRDTTVVVGQPLHFNASGGTGFLWSPSTGLSSTVIHNPVGRYDASIDSVRYKVIVSDDFGCSDSAFVNVYVFKTNPSIFVPTAFTPNGDGRNDVIRPIAVGMQRINYFNIYNRWGELVFTTSENKRGWDGRIGGVLQGSGVFVWMVSAIDYLGKPIFQKGTVTLIR